jgi:hypothetical protein
VAEVYEKDNLELRIERTKAEYAGIEFDAENMDPAGEEEKQPFDLEKIRVDQQMLSVKYMLELMEEDGIELNPGYQRNYVWEDNKRKSLLIESLILGIPISAFYFYEREDGRYQVIDGQQRLTTIKEFVEGRFCLTGLEYLGKECNKKFFGELDKRYKQKIYRTQIAANILDARSPKSVIYDIFRRVNTGGMSLNLQEMRNAVCKQEVRDFLLRSTRNENYLRATRNKIRDIRMDSQELVLRFYAFYRAYDFEREKLNYDYYYIADMLDNTVEDLNEMGDAKRETLYKRFDLAMARSYDAFGEYAFSKIQNNDGTIKKVKFINKALFSSFSVLLLNPKYDHVDIKACQGTILGELAKELCDSYYKDAISVGTGNRRNVYINFEHSRKVLERCLG